MLKLLILFLLAVSAKGSSLNYNLYSISTSALTNEKELVIINPWDYTILVNNTVNTRYDIIDILSLDTTTDTMLVLGSDSAYQILMTVDSDSKNFQQLSEVSTGYDFIYAVQPYLYMQDSKTATIPAQVKINGTYYNCLMESDFNTQSLNLLNFTELGNAPYTIQGFDYVNNIDYIAYLNFNTSFHLMSFDYSNPESTVKYYYNIQNILLVTMIFTDPAGNLYFVNEGYINSTTPSGWYDLCKVTLSEVPGESTCTSILNFYLGQPQYYTYEPMILSEDKSTILFMANQDPSSGSAITKEFNLTFVQFTSNTHSVYQVSILNDDPNNDLYSSRNFKF